MKAFKNNNDVWIYGILIVFSSAAALLAVTNIKISPDSMRFGLVSQQILSGNGIRVPIMRLEDNYVPVNGAIPFLDQMPLLPMLFAILGGVTPQNFLPAQIINLISHVAISLFAFLLMRNLYNNKGIAFLTGILVSFSFPLLRAAHHIWSESLFIALIVAAIYFLVLSRSPDRRHFNRNLFIAGICTSAAILTRNAGIALIPVFFWEAFILLKNKKLKSEYGNYGIPILAITLPIITVIATFVRNYIISGSLRGFKQLPFERSYISAVAGTIEMIYSQFQLGRNSFILVFFFTILFLLCIFINADLRKGLLKYFSSGLDLIIVFIVIYSALICITMAKQQWNFELRYVYPLVPFLLISTMFVIVFIWERITLKGLSKLSFAGMILFLGIITFGNFHKTLLNLSEFSSKQEGQYFIVHSCAYNWLKEHYKEDVIITTNKPFHLSFFGGYSTVALPHTRFDPTTHIPDDMEIMLPDRMVKFGSRVLVLFEEAEERYDGRYIARLFNKRKDYDKFTLAHVCPDGVVYNLKE